VIFQIQDKNLNKIMIIVTTLVIPVGGDAGPFDLYTDSDGYTVPFATNISAAALQAGYSSTVPNDATIVRVVSVGACTNFIDLDIDLLPTTTTTTSTNTSSTTTTTTTVAPTTTTTTTFNNYRIEDCINLITYVLPKTFVFTLGETVQYQVGVPGAGLQRCGVIIDTSANLPPTASLVGGVSYPCEDTLHCPTS
jgi:hypothetical protein